MIDPIKNETFEGNFVNSGALDFLAKLNKHLSLNWKLLSELKTSRRYLKLIVQAAQENKLSIKYINELSDKDSVYYPIISEFYSIVVYFWVKSRARKIK